MLAQLNTEVPGLVYHAQVTSYYCGSATVEMMLDNSAVRNNDPFLNYVLNPANAPDPLPGSFFNGGTGQDATFGTIPFNAVNNAAQSIHPTFGQRVVPGVNGGNPVSAVTYGPQLFIYDFAHGPELTRQSLARTPAYRLVTSIRFNHGAQAPASTANKSP